MQRTNTPGLSLFKVLFVVVLLVSMITLAGTASATRDRPGVQRASQTGPYATSSGAVNVRVGPGTGFAIAGLLSTGEAVPILGVSPDGGWWYVAAPFGEGWVSNISVTAANTSGVPVRDPGPMATVASGAPTSGAAQGHLRASWDSSDRVRRFSCSARIRTARGCRRCAHRTAGWVSAQLVVLSGVPGIIQDALPVTGEGPYAIVRAAYLNVRTGPGDNYAILGAVGASDELPIVGRTADSTWFQVQTPFGTGWVSGSYVITRNEFGAAPITTESAQDAPVSGPVGIINTGALNIRSGPGIQYSSLGVLAGGTETRIIGRTRDWSWWLLETPLGNGWANRIYVIVRGSTSNVPYVAPGEAVPPSDGTEGGESPEPAVALPLAIVNTGALHVRSGPNSTFSSLGSVYAGAILSIIGQSPDRGWWLVHSAYGDGWISKAFSYTTGDTSGVPVIN